MLFLRPLSVRSVIITWVRLSMVAEISIGIWNVVWFWITSNSSFLYYLLIYEMFKMAAANLDAHSDSLDYGRTAASLTRLAASKILWSSSSLRPPFIHIPRSSRNPTHGSLADWGPVTAVANSENRHGWSTGEGVAHSDTAPRSGSELWGFPVMLVVHL